MFNVLDAHLKEVHSRPNQWVQKNSFGCAIDRALSTSVQNSLDINLTQIGFNLRLRLNFALISSQFSPWT